MKNSQSQLPDPGLLTSLHRFNLQQNDSGIADILFLAVSLCDTPFATINLFQDDALTYSKIHGTEQLDDLEFSQQVLAQRSPLHVSDTLKDSRFSSSPLVQQAPDIRMYAGFPLIFSSAQLVGNLAILGPKPGTLDQAAIEGMERLALLCARLLEFNHLESNQKIINQNMEIAALASWAHDRVNNLFLFNDRFYAMLGTTAEREGGYLMPTSVYVQEFCHADDAKLVAEVMAATLSSPDPSFVHRIEHRIIKRDGEVRDISVASGLIKNEKGETVLTYGANQDITERKTIERELTKVNADLELRIEERTREVLEQERRANHAQRLSSVGQMAAGVAHDLNGALTPIVLGIEILQDKYPDDIELIQMMESNARRSAEMIDQLMTFSKGTTGDPSPINLKSLLMELHLLIQKTFPANINVDIDLDQNLPMVMGDTTKLYQLLLNFCANAKDAMPEGGILKIEAKMVDVDRELANESINGNPGRFVELAVSDTGVGISPTVIDRIFDPYFTTKSHDKGSGIGLSTALGIARGMEGFINVKSAEKSGSRFTAYLPPIIEQSITVPEPEIQARIQGNGKKILVVDDDPAIRNLMKAVLTKMHFRVITASDGSEALFKVSDNLHDLSAVLTDIHMPNMDGPTFMQTLKYMLPDVAVIAISGSLGEETSTQLDELGIRHRLLKPFSINKLVTTLQQALDRQSGSRA